MNLVIEELIYSFGFGFELLWVFVLLPLPVFIAKLNRSKSMPANALVRASHFEHFTLPYEHNLKNKEGVFNRMTKVVLWLSWFFFVITLSRPFTLGEAIQQPQPTRDIMLAVDLSESMADRDMQMDNQAVTRLDLAKQVISDFIAKRTNDRLGLVFFADTAYLASPLTTDSNTLTFLLEQSQVGMIGDATSITDAIGLTTKLFTNYSGELPALILLTDGDNTSGNLQKSEAVNLALSANIQIFSIVLQVGDQQEQNQIDLGFLEALVDGSGGELYFASDAQTLTDIYLELERRALNSSVTSTHFPKHYLHFYTMLVCIFSICVLILPFIVGKERKYVT